MERKTILAGSSVRITSELLAVEILTPLLDNLRYATSVCLWGWPTHKKNVSSPCDIDYACHPLQKALETGNLNPANETEYQYCTAGGSVFQSSSVQNCIQCLQASSDQNYMSNCMNIICSVTHDCPC